MGLVLRTRAGHLLWPARSTSGSRRPPGAGTLQTPQDEAHVIDPCPASGPGASSCNPDRDASRRLRVRRRPRLPRCRVSRIATWTT